MQGQTIREKLHNGDRVYGIHICNLNGPRPANLCAKLELDYVFIDLEHTPVDRGEAAFMCGFYAAHGISPLVRVPYPNPHLAAAALDGGAQGIVVPYIETVEEVRDLVGAVRYRPLKGKKLRDVLAGKHRLNDETAHYIDEFNRQTYLLIGVESVAAVDNLNALISVDGVDGVFIGPHDLTVSMEIPQQYTNPDFVDTVNNIIRTSRATGLGVGMHLIPNNSSPEQIEQYMDEGMNFILYSHDAVIMADSITRDLKALRQIKGDTFTKE